MANSERAVIGVALPTAYTAVIPVGMVTGSPLSMALAFVCVYPYCHLFFRWRRRRG